MKKASKLFTFAIITALMALCSAMPAAAATSDTYVNCYAPTTGGASLGVVSTEAGSGESTDSSGYTFDHSTDEEIWCEWLVPTDYYSASTTEPSILLVGWSTDCVICIPTCGNRTVQFEVASRAYDTGLRLNADWSTPIDADITIPAASCTSPCGTDCYKHEYMREGTADLTDDAENFEPGDLVFIQILRDTDVTGDLPSDFHLSLVRVTYPTS